MLVRKKRMECNKEELCQFVNCKIIGSKEHMESFD